jgi:mannose-1-phosphate guanylyltransferase
MPISNLHVIVLAGGSGTRFWPASRRRRPKQLLVLEPGAAQPNRGRPGDRSLLQATVDRLAPLVAAERVWVCTGAALVDEVRHQLPEVPAEQVLAEPVGRNTAAAIGWSVRSLPAAAQGEVVAVLPSDHRIGDAEAFRATLAAAAAAVERHDLVMTLGVVPRFAETGFGYLELGDAIDGAAGEASSLRRVSCFREKPDAATAAAFLASGRHLWNAGIFVFRGSTMLAAIERHQPVLAAGLARLAAAPESLAEVYPTLPSISIDHGVMEHLSGIGALPLDCGWSDLGSWAALAEILPTDANGNAMRGDSLVVDGRDNLVFVEQGTVALLGVEGLVVVRSGDAVLVMPRSRAQDLRQVVAALEAAHRDDLL